MKILSILKNLNKQAFTSPDEFFAIRETIELLRRCQKQLCDDRDSYKIEDFAQLQIDLNDFFLEEEALSSETRLKKSPESTSQTLSESAENSNSPSNPIFQQLVEPCSHTVRLMEQKKVLPGLREKRKRPPASDD